MNNEYKMDKIVTGYVTGIKDYGIFVQLDNSKSGLIHISEISEKFVKDVGKYAELGELIRVRILSQGDNNHYMLSIKNLDYRIMKKKSKIVETESGFKNLAISLDFWLKRKLKELENSKDGIKKAKKV